MSGNGGILPGLPSLGESEKQCAELLAEVLELANEGKIHSIGILVCMDEGFATVMRGKQAGDLHLAAACFQDNIKSEVMSGNVAKRKSGIIRVGR